MTVKPHTACRACGAESLVQYLDLGSQAPANALRSPTEAFPEFTAPLSVSYCENCGLSQLDQVVDPKILYDNYPFRAGASDKWKRHCMELMNDVAGMGRRFLVDIGSNDGVLLQEASLRGYKVLGVDPTPYGSLPSLEGLWSERMAGSITRFHGQADVITATNVFGHVDDAKDFLSGVAIALKPSGRAVIECPHIIPLLDQTAFDTIYHEHLTYWSLRPLEMLAEPLGLRIVDVKSFPSLHGGTMRYTLMPGDNRTKIKTSVTGLRILESALFQRGIAPYQEFAERAQSKIQQFRETLVQQRRAGKRIWGYGANAKGAVLLQAACLSEATIERIVDDAEPKWGLLMPGSHIPITNAQSLAEPDVLVLLSWNNGAELMAKAHSRGFTGSFVTPNPEMEKAA